MIDLTPLTGILLPYAASNFAIALPIGLVAWWAQTQPKRPALAHWLWLFVLLKLVTPPVFQLPIVPLPPVEPLLAAPIVSIAAFGESAPNVLSALWTWQTLIVALWLLGSASILAWSSVFIVRFNRLLKLTSKPADPKIQREASTLAGILGLSKVPAIFSTSASISPMVWWIGGRVRIYLPSAMLAQIPPGELRWILAHELGHVRRGDHFVRWLECVTCIVLWWNPLAWWARRNLRINEEICCDTFVLSKIEAPRRIYAGALVSAMECLATPAIRPSALASGINGGGSIERRIEMILSKQSTVRVPAWLRGTSLIVAAALLPLGFSLAQGSGDLERVAQWLESGVNSAYVTQEQADIMLAALRRSTPEFFAYAEESKRNIVRMERDVTEAMEQTERLFETGQISGEDARRRMDEIEARAEEMMREAEMQRTQDLQRTTERIEPGQ